MGNLDTAKISQTSDETSKDDPKGDDSRVPIYMWYRRSLTYKGVGVIEALKIIWEGIMRWQRFKLMRYFVRY